MAAAHVPEETTFATKPALAAAMIAAAQDAGVAAAWATGDEVYGADPHLRAELERRQVGYVLAVARSHRVTTGIGRRRAVDLVVRLPRWVWQTRSAGAGAHGERLYQWTLIEIRARTAGHLQGQHHLLVRRNRTTGELAFYRTWTPHPVPLSALVRVAGTRWNVEEGFQTGKELTALDEHQVRTWTSWQRWTVLAMLAHAFLTVITAAQRQPSTVSDELEDLHAPLPALIPLTRNEIRHLLAQLTRRIQPTTAHVLHWSIWRRHRQAHTRTAHYQRQAMTE